MIQLFTKFKVLKVKFCDEHEQWGINMMNKLSLYCDPQPILCVTPIKEDQDDTTTHEV